MRRNCYFLIFLFFFVLPELTGLGFSCPVLAAEILLVPLKKSLPLPLPVGKTVHISDGHLFKIRELKGQLIATGSKEGEATLRQGFRAYTVFVLDSTKIHSYTLLQQFIKSEALMGLFIDICELSVCIKGELLTLKDYEKLIRFAQIQNLQWRIAFQMRPALKLQMENTLHKAFTEFQFPSLDFNFSPYGQISVPKNNTELVESAKRFFPAYGLLPHLKDSVIGSALMVDLKVEIVEFKKSAFSKMGIDSPTSYRASVVPSQIQTLPFEIALHSLEQQGEAQILASPRLSCRSGEQAHFLAGGEFPIRIINYQTNDLQWKKHGILLNFKPLAESSGKISMSLTAEVSLLDSSQTVDGVPGLLVNRVESHVDMKSKETLSLSGLIKKIKGHSKQGLHTLSQIPILGLLFGSEDYRNDESDLVIFITPQIL